MVNAFAFVRRGRPGQTFTFSNLTGQPSLDRSGTPTWSRFRREVWPASVFLAMSRGDNASVILQASQPETLLVRDTTRSPQVFPCSSTAQQLSPIDSTAKSSTGCVAYPVWFYPVLGYVRRCLNQ